MQVRKTKTRRRNLFLCVIAGAALVGAVYPSMRAAPPASAAETPGDRPAAPDGNRPDGPPARPGNPGQNDDPQRGDRRPPGPPGLQRAIDGLELTVEQKQKIDPIVEEFHKKQQQAREDFLKQMKAALTSEQYQKIESVMMRPPGPPPQRQGNQDTDARPQESASQNRRPNRDGENGTADLASTAKIDPSLGVPVTLTGGFDTDPRDHGRPVVLIAAALKVSSDIFRDAFSHVTPAAGGREPEDAQVRLNKQALMQRLSPLGVTDDRLNAVSNFNRYSSGNGQMWRHTPAVVYATVHNGKVTGFTIADAGAGYSSPPKISIAGMDNVNATATLSFGTEFAKNGSLKEIAIRP